MRLHFDFREQASLTGDVGSMGSVDVPIHLGIAVVTPIESLDELLTRDDVIEDRIQRESGFLIQP